MSSFFADLLAQKQPHFQTNRALIVVGLQNDFCSPGGKLPVTQPPALLDRIKDLVPIFRDKAGQVIWVRTELQPNQPEDDADDADAIVTTVPAANASSEDDSSAAELTSEDLPSSSGRRAGSSRGFSSRSAELLKRIQARSQTLEAELDATSDEELFLAKGASAQICIAGSPGADWADDIASEIKPEDTLVTKNRYSALKGTNLLLTLRAKLVTELYVCGCISNISVYATAVEAARHGIEIYLLDDCVGYRRLDRHREAIRQMVEYMGAQVVSSTDLISQLTGQPSKGDDSKRERKADDADDLGDRLKNLKLKDKDTTPSEASSSRAKPVEPARGPARESPIAASSAPLEVADSDDGLLSEEGLLPVRRLSSRSRPTEAQQVPTRTSGSIKSKIRMRRKPSQKSQSPPEVPDSNQRADSKDATGAAKGGQITLASASKLTGRDASSSENSTTSTPKSSSPQPSGPKTADLKDGSADSQPSKKSAATPAPTQSKKIQNLATLPTLGPSDQIGEGDSSVVYDFLPPSLRAPGAPDKALVEGIFQKLYNEVRWQKMMHAQGEVPRLVAVQGEYGADGSMPVYRHPSDQSPPLLHFSPAVLLIRKQVEELVKHPVNHVLIQLYRDGQDYISEHSDKTLDIVKGSSIVNISFGAQRTMRLRTKRSAKPEPAADASSARQTQRVPMPHNSAFVLGPQTNMCWLHGINADKRPSEDKSDAEKEFSGMRISLTFRNIGTFLNSDGSKIWGQGATAKTRDDAQTVINGDEKKTEELIRAFSKENQATEFDWEATYGHGYDVLHFRDAPPETTIVYASHNPVERQSVLLYLQDLGLEHTLVEPPAAAAQNLFDYRQICLRDTDDLHTEICGATLILSYLESHYCNRIANNSEALDPSFQPGDRAAVAAAKTYVELASHLGRLWFRYGKVTPTNDADTNTAAPSSDILKAVEADLAAIEEHLTADHLRRVASESSPFLAGNRFSIADCAIWPLVNAVRASWEGWSEDRYPCLARYLQALAEAREDVKAFTDASGAASAHNEEKEQAAHHDARQKDDTPKEAEEKGEGVAQTKIAEKGKGKAN